MLYYTITVENNSYLKCGVWKTAIFKLYFYQIVNIHISREDNTVQVLIEIFYKSIHKTFLQVDFLILN
jgi:hypothetical protein